MGRHFRDRNIDRQATAEWGVIDEAMIDLHLSPLHRAVYMFAAMTSIVIFQMYFVTFCVSLSVAVLSMRWFWNTAFPVFLPTLLGTVTVVLLSTLVINRCEHWCLPCIGAHECSPVLMHQQITVGITAGVARSWGLHVQ
jgi:hypothetical protein